MDSYASLYFMTDLDGTLLPSSKEILPVDRAAIEIFRHAGGRFSIATGRTLQAAGKYIRDLHLDQPAIVFNGAALYDPVSAELLDVVTLPEEIAALVEDVLTAFPNVGAEILTADSTYVPRLNTQEQEHLGICGVTPVLGPLKDVPRQMWMKVLFATDPREMDALMAFIADQHCDSVDFVRSEDRFYEILPKGVSKGSALDKLRRRLGEETILIGAGDYDNDVGLLTRADFGVCPANGAQSVKNVADLTLACSCENGATAELITYILANRDRLRR